MKQHPLAKQLKEHMAKHDMSHADMAKKCGIGPERMKKLTAGHPPTQEEMKKCKKLGFTPRAGKAQGGDEDPIKTSMEEEPDKEMSIDGMPVEDMEVPHQVEGEDGESDLHKIDEGEHEESPEHDSDEADENYGHQNEPNTTLTDPATIGFLQMTNRDEEGAVVLSRETMEELTGESDPKAQAKALVELRRKAQMFDRDHETLKELRADSEARERRELVELGRREHKLDPTQEKFWARQPVKLFREWIKTAPVLNGGSAELQPLAPTTIGGVALTREEMEANSLMSNNDVGEFAAFKRDMAGAKPFELSQKVSQTILNSFLGRTDSK